MLHRGRFLGAAAATIAALPGRAFGQTPAALHVASTASDSYAEALYATDQGFFSRAGLAASLQVLASGAAITAAVAGGAIDIGISNPLPLIEGVEHGIPFVYICSGGLVNYDESSLCVASNSAIHTGKDFAGKTIATTSLDDINVIAIKAWIDQTGGDSTQAKFVEMPFSVMGPSLARGTVDAAPIAEPALSAAKGAGTVRVLLPPMNSVFGPSAMLGGWFCRADWLAKNRDPARRFVAAIYETARWANGHHDESALILAKYAKLDPEMLKAMNRAPYGTSLTPNMLQSVLDLAYKYKAVAKPYKASDIIARI